MLATQRLLKRLVEEPRSEPRSVSGKRLVPFAIRPRKVMVSVMASPRVTLPFKVDAPVTERAPPAVRVSEKKPEPRTSRVAEGFVRPMPILSVSVDG